MKGENAEEQKTMVILFRGFLRGNPWSLWFYDLLFSPRKTRKSTDYNIRVRCTYKYQAALQLNCQIWPHCKQAIISQRRKDVMKGENAEEQKTMVVLFRGFLRGNPCNLWF
jgi:hypothetical protein